MTFGRRRSQQPYLGEVAVFAGNFAPRGSARCEGQLLPIKNNQAPVSLLGAMYGGDGRTTFALPDLRGRTVVGTMDGLPTGAVVGTDDQVILSSDIPSIDVTGTAAGESFGERRKNDGLHGGR